MHTAQAYACVSANTSNVSTERRLPRFPTPGVTDSAEDCTSYALMRDNVHHLS